MTDFNAQLRAHEARARQAEAAVSAADREAARNQALLNDTKEKPARLKLIHAIKRFQWRARQNRARLALERVRANMVRKQIAGASSRLTAVRWALSKVGVTEKPPYSNSGPWISDWIRKGGGEPGYAWCQYFCNAVLVAGGGVQLQSGYTPSVVQWGKDKAHGLRTVSLSQARPGDFVYFKFPGVSGDICDHVGLFVSQDAGTVTCVEGNTSPGNGGSQYNGGGVFKRTRPKGLVVYVVSPTYRGE